MKKKLKKYLNNQNNVEYHGLQKGAWGVSPKTITKIK